MERLTWKDESGYYAPKNVTLNCLKQRGELVDRLAAYEDLEEQGRLIVLPCKVGDTVYKPLGKNEEILPIKIQWFETNNYGWCACGTYPPRATYALRFADLGKTWFTDRAEAEKAMEVSEDA